MKLHAFAGFDQAPHLKAHDNLSVLDSLSLEDLTNIPECDLLWQPIVHGYHGKMVDKACVYDEQGEPVYADYQMMLDDRSLWKGDFIRRVSDGTQINSKPEVLHKQLRARWFTCNMGFSGEDTEENFLISACTIKAVSILFRSQPETSPTVKSVSACAMWIGP